MVQIYFLCHFYCFSFFFLSCMYWVRISIHQGSITCLLQKLTPIIITYKVQTCHLQFHFVEIFLQFEVQQVHNSRQEQPPEVFYAKRCSQKFHKFHSKTPVPESHLVSSLIMLQAQAYNFIKKEALAQVFSCEISENSKNMFFTEHLWTTASIQSSPALAFHWKINRLVS